MATPPVKPTPAAKPAPAKKAAAAKKPVAAKKPAVAKKPAAPRKAPVKKPAKAAVPVGKIAIGAAAVAAAGGAAFAANKLGKDGIADLARRGLDKASGLTKTARKSAQGLIDKARGKPAKSPKPPVAPK